MVPRVERTAAPKRATHAPKKEKAKSNTQVFISVLGLLIGFFVVVFFEVGVHC